MITTTRKKQIWPLWILALILFAGLEHNVAAQASPTSKTERLLKTLKVPYSPFQGSDSFVVVYKRKDLSEISVIIVEAGSAVVVFADVAASREIDLTPEIMRKLLEYNLKVDFVKAGISNIGSIRVQSEQSLAIAPKEFGELLDQMAAAAGEIDVMLRPAKRRATALMK